VNICDLNLVKFLVILALPETNRVLDYPSARYSIFDRLSPSTFRDHMVESTQLIITAVNSFTSASQTLNYRETTVELRQRCVSRPSESSEVAESRPCAVSSAIDPQRVVTGGNY
jgi:hypothetical protein